MSQPRLAPAPRAQRRGDPQRGANRKPRGRGRFTQAEITRAIRGAQKAALQIAAVRILPDGTILIIPGTPASVAPWEANPWDA